MMSTCLPHHMWMAKPGLAPIDVYIGRLDWIWSLCIWMWIGAGKCPTPLRRSYTAHTMESHYRSRVAWKTWTGFSKKMDRFKKKWKKIWKIIKKSPMSTSGAWHCAILPPSVDFGSMAGNVLKAKCLHEVLQAACQSPHQLFTALDTTPLLVLEGILSDFT